MMHRLSLRPIPNLTWRSLQVPHRIKAKLRLTSILLFFTNQTPMTAVASTSPMASMLLGTWRIAFLRTTLFRLQTSAWTISEVVAVQRDARDTMFLIFLTRNKDTFNAAASLRSKNAKVWIITSNLVGSSIIKNAKIEHLWSWSSGEWKLESFPVRTDTAADRTQLRRRGIIILITTRKVQGRANSCSTNLLNHIIAVMTPPSNRHIAIPLLWTRSQINHQPWTPKYNLEDSCNKVNSRHQLRLSPPATLLWTQEVNQVSRIHWAFHQIHHHLTNNLLTNCLLLSLVTSTHLHQNQSPLDIRSLSKLFMEVTNKVNDKTGADAPQIDSFQRRSTNDASLNSFADSAESNPSDKL